MVEEQTNGLFDDKKKETNLFFLPKGHKNTLMLKQAKKLYTSLMLIVQFMANFTIKTYLFLRL